jgi:predicted Zn-dependent protease
MTAEERLRLEREAERALKRGELVEAVSHLRLIAAQAPSDSALAERIAQLEASLEPSERARLPTNHTPPPQPSPSPLAQAEHLAHRGDYAGAVVLLQTYLRQTPNALVEERLAELVALAHARAPARANPGDKTLLLAELLRRIETRRRK